MSEQQPLRVGVVGGGIGKRHIRSYREDPDCQVVAICDTDEGRARSVANELGVPEVYTDAQTLFDSGRIDVVSIATPNTLHAPLSIEAMESGLHVLCEKPMAMNAHEAQQMVDAARRLDRKLAIHFNHRMQPGVQFLRRCAEAGELGEIYFARTIWHRTRGIPARASFLSKTNSGGGAMIDLGVHMLDQTLWIMGYPDVTHVSASAVTRFDTLDVPQIPMDVDDFATAYLRLANGATMVLEISWASHHDKREQMLMQVYGDKGGALRQTEPGGGTQVSLHRREHGAVTTTQMSEPPTDLHNVQTDFLDAIRNDREPVCSAEHGLITMRVLDGIYESSRLGREVDLTAEPVARNGR